jgi:hypothetical protein
MGLMQQVSQQMGLPMMMHGMNPFGLAPGSEQGSVLDPTAEEAAASTPWGLIGVYPRHPHVDEHPLKTPGVLINDVVPGGGVSSSSPVITSHIQDALSADKMIIHFPRVMCGDLTGTLEMRGINFSSSHASSSNSGSSLLLQQLMTISVGDDKSAGCNNALSTVTRSLILQLALSYCVPDMSCFGISLRHLSKSRALITLPVLFTDLYDLVILSAFHFIFTAYHYII